MFKSSYEDCGSELLVSEGRAIIQDISVSARSALLFSGRLFGWFVCTTDALTPRGGVRSAHRALHNAGLVHNDVRTHGLLQRPSTASGEVFRVALCDFDAARVALPSERGED